MDLAEQERRERIAGLREVVAARVVAAGAQAVEVELRRAVPAAPAAEREIDGGGTRSRP